MKARRPGAGRPRLDRTPEQRLALAREYSRATTERQRAGRVLRTLYLTPIQAARLDRAQAAGGFGSVNALIETIVGRAPEPEEEPTCPTP